MDFDINAVFVKIPLTQSCNHIKIMLINICESNFNIVKFRNCHKVRKERAGETNASGADDCKFNHNDTPLFFVAVIGGIGDVTDKKVHSQGISRKTETANLTYALRSGD